MTDYFALLEQPQRPWLDLDRLKEIYHRKTLQEHPDVQTNRSDSEASEVNFANLNEAYQVLRDPKRRLHHFLCLEGSEPIATTQIIPPELYELFSEIGPLANAARTLLDEMQKTSTALSRALLKPKLIELQNQAKTIRDKIRVLSHESDAELKRINQVWGDSPTEQIESLKNLYLIYAYLTRWSVQLDEIIFQLSP